MALKRKGQPMLEENMRIEEEESDFSESESEEEEDDETMKLAEPAKKAVYNSEGLMDKLADIKWPENIEWIHSLSVEVEQGPEKVDVEDDLARELSFYNQALEGTKTAFARVEGMGIPFLRPPDYYAEMVKTDSHMEKVKGRLLEEKKRIEEAEERRKARESKRMSKEVQSAKLRERSKTKKDEIESVKKWRKDRQKSGFAKGDDDNGEFAFEDGKPFEKSAGNKRPGVAPWDRSGGKAGRKGPFSGRGGGRGGSGGGGREGGGRGGSRGGGRDFKDSRYGFGGRKNKQNTAETAGDVRGFGGASFSKSSHKKRKM